MEILANVVAEVDGRKVSIQSDGTTCRIQLPDMRTAVRLFRWYRKSTLLPALPVPCDFEFAVHGMCVALCRRPLGSPFERQASLWPVRIHWGNVVRLLLGVG